MQLSYFSNGEIFHQSMSVYQRLNERMPFNSSNKTRLEICIIYEPEALYSSLEKHPVETSGCKRRDLGGGWDDVQVEFAFHIYAAKHVELHWCVI